MFCFVCFTRKTLSMTILKRKYFYSPLILQQISKNTSWGKKHLQFLWMYSLHLIQRGKPFSFDVLLLRLISSTHSGSLYNTSYRFSSCWWRHCQKKIPESVHKNKLETYPSQHYEKHTHDMALSFRVLTFQAHAPWNIPVSQLYMPGALGK